MRAVNYFIKRFGYAAKGNGTIKLNQNDIDALNQIIEFYDDYKYSVDGNKIYVNKLKATINEYMKEDVIHVHKVVKRKSIKVYNYVQ